MLKRETIEELNKILKEEFRQNLPIEKVAELGEFLVKFFELLAQKYHQNMENTKNENASQNNQNK